MGILHLLIICPPSPSVSAMTQRNYDADLKDLISLLPTVADFSTVEKVREVRAMG